MGRSLRPSWHGMVNGLSPGAVVFVFAHDTRLTDAGVLGHPPRHVLYSFYIPPVDHRMTMARRGVFVRAEEVAADKPSEPQAPVRGRQLEALRAVAASPGGLRHDAHPSALPVLQELGNVEERATRGRTGRRAWHLTPAGRKLLAALGIREDAEP
jgi:hypothetical protein